MRLYLDLALEHQQNLVVLYFGDDAFIPKPCLTPESSSDGDFVGHTGVVFLL